MKIERRRLIELRNGDHASREEMRELCSLALAHLNASEAASRSSLEREALAKEPIICTICDKEIGRGQPTAAGLAHWSCHIRAMER